VGNDKPGLFSRLRTSLKRTQERLTLRLAEVFTGRTTVDAELFGELEAALLEADFGMPVTERLMKLVAERVRAERIEDPAEVREVLKQAAMALLTRPGSAVPPPAAPPVVTLVVGVNGTGKTTTIGKLAWREAALGRSVVLAAADTFRAAAGEQLAVWADRAGVRLVRHQEGADPSAVAYDALETAIARGADCVIIDTAGRLHTKDNLMAELEKVRRVVAKRLPGAPHEVLLVLDGTTGQNAVVQAREFAARVGLTGLVVTKLDGTARGGVVAAIVGELGVPVRYVGTGEGREDLAEFDARTFVDAVFG
jgi:fused signal recognition particle receptor